MIFLSTLWTSVVHNTLGIVLSQIFFGMAFVMVAFPFKERFLSLFHLTRKAKEGKKLHTNFDESEVKRNALVLSICLFPILVVAGFSFWIAFAVSFFSALGLPKFMLFRARKEFERQFDEALPDSLASIASSLKAGLTIQKALEVAVASCPKIFANEAKQILREYSFGSGIDAALEGVRTRVKTPATNMSFGALILGRKLGGPLPLILSRIADTVRDKIRVEGKLDSLTAQGKAQGFILCGAPFLVGAGMAFFDKEKFALLTDTLPGQMILAVAVLLWVVGVGITWKVMQLEV